MVFRASGDKYEIFLNGEKVITQNTINNNGEFLSRLEGLNTVDLGITRRPLGQSEYKYIGDISNVQIYSTVLSDRIIQDMSLNEN